MHEQHQQHPMEHHRRPVEHHHHHHHHHMELYRRVMPFIEDAHMAHPDIGRMSPEQLHVLADRVMHDSGVLHQVPPGHTEDSVRDMVKVLILHTGDDMAAVETFNPIVPLALGPWFWPWGWGGGPWFGPRGRGHFRRGHGGRGGGRGRR